jgi:hypothetical protein
MVGSKDTDTERPMLSHVVACALCFALWRQRLFELDLVLAMRSIRAIVIAVACSDSCAFQCSLSSFSGRRHVSQTQNHNSCLHMIADNRRHAYTVRQAAAGAMLGLLLSAQAALALGSMVREIIFRKSASSCCWLALMHCARPRISYISCNCRSKKSKA